VDKEKQNIPVMTPAELERLDQEKTIKHRLSKIGRKILVMSGKGGVGKSTVAAYMALILSKNGKQVGLLDVDLHGPTIPHLLDIRGGLVISEDGLVKPYFVSDRLRAVSLEMLVHDKDAAVIWRGPIKISAIKQFISDIDWGQIDYLIIDSPPGTGDEPLTVAQTIPEAEAIIVTTPQEISLADVRKSINFCRQVNMRIVGVVENMSGLMCPHCHQPISIFGSGGGQKMADQKGVAFLGTIPIEPLMVEYGDSGHLADLASRNDLGINSAYQEVLDKVERTG